MNEIIHGDSLEVLREVGTNSIDLVCTDPPYGYSFMGKDWDRAVPSVELLQECLRVLKPGAFAFVMSAPRQDVLSQMIVRLDEAGFEMGFTSIYWTYASGFPKALNIAKAVDKKYGAKGEVLAISHRGAGSSPQKISNHGKGDTGVGMLDGHRKAFEMTAALQAKALDGSYGGFQPKPAVEVILVCMKPLSARLYVEQALMNGKGITWLDDARIPYEVEDSIIAKNPHTQRGNSRDHTEIYGEYQPSRYELPNGRFPANLLVSDDALNDGRITKSTTDRNMHEGDTGSWFAEKHRRFSRGDSGSFSRYFDLDQWAQRTFPFLTVPKACKREKNQGLQQFDKQKTNDGRRKEIENPFQRGSTLRHNHHPTVKPIKLMAYLITLGSRRGDIVLDPFVGSGTTCIAAKMLGRKYIGIDREERYVKLARARIDFEATSG
jgi:site-specific DNA-methyltransferase (adenine-specific)